MTSRWNGGRGSLWGSWSRAVALAAMLVLTWCGALFSECSAATTNRPIVMHPAFGNAGKQAGLRIWRIENFEPVPYPPKDYGKFYSGDSYIVLNTKEDKSSKGKFTWDIHFWLGNQTSQLTEEKLGTSDKTEFDAHFENLAALSDNTKKWTENILRNTEAVLTPNPGNRVEDYLFEKIDKKKPNRLTNLEYLGLDMIEAGNDFGPGTSYGSALIKVGQYEQKLGVVEREFIAAANQSFVSPLTKFLETEMKTVSKERSILESKRLDLDACKNRVRKARGMLGMPAGKDGLSPEFVLEEAERDLRVAQSEFDRQQEITKLLLEGVSSSRAGHLRCLHEFVEAQSNYHARCHELMKELQQELQSSSSDLHPNSTNSSPTTQTAKALCDYDAKDSTELSVLADELVTVVSECNDNSDYVLCKKGPRQGRIPKMFLLFK